LDSHDETNNSNVTLPTPCSENAEILSIDEDSPTKGNLFNN